MLSSYSEFCSISQKSLVVTLLTCYICWMQVHVSLLKRIEKANIEVNNVVFVFLSLHLPLPLPLDLYLCVYEVPVAILLKQVWTVYHCQAYCLKLLRTLIMNILYILQVCPENDDEISEASFLAFIQLCMVPFC